MKLQEIVRQMTKHFNSIIHADTEGLDTNIGVTQSGSVGYLSGANVRDPERCDHICDQAVTYISVLMKRAADIFPEDASSQGEGASQLHSDGLFGKQVIRPV